jgi:hypothetical protein
MLPTINLNGRVSLKQCPNGTYNWLIVFGNSGPVAVAVSFGNQSLTATAPGVTADVTGATIPSPMTATPSQPSQPTVHARVPPTPEQLEEIVPSHWTKYYCVAKGRNVGIFEEWYVLSWIPFNLCFIIVPGTMKLKPMLEG